MKKYFIKITAFLLLAFIFPMIGGLCFQDLARSIAKIDIARASDNRAETASALGSGYLATVDMKNMNMADMVNTDMEVCSKEKVSESANHYNLKTKTPLSFPQNNNSVLPCCVGGTHPDLIIAAQSFEIHKLISFPAYNFEKLPLNLRNLSAEIFYQAPLTAPPELVSLKTTVLRI